MRKKKQTKDSTNYDATYRFRCYSDLKTRAAVVAAKRGSGDASDVGREGVIKHVEQLERELGLAAAR